MRIAIVLASCAVVLSAAAAVAQEVMVDEAAVQKAADELLKKKVESLMAIQKKDGHWERGEYSLGMTGLAALALKHSNDPRAATSVALALEYLDQAATEAKTYTAGMVISAMYQGDPRVHMRTISRYAEQLCKSQTNGQHPGMYAYDLIGLGKPIPGSGDNSNTQFGVLGLLFADRAGYQVPRAVWQKVHDHFLKTQNPDGGWGYTPGGNSYHNMTFAGTVSLYIAEEQLQWGESADHCRLSQPSRATEAAMNWVGTHFSADLNAYGLYAMERLGILTGFSEFGGHYWYDEGVRRIVGAGVAKTAWVSSGDSDDAFTILFLARGREPIVVNKLKYYGDWNNNNYDVKHVTDYISDRMQTPMQWRIVTLQSKLEDLLKVPILHYNGIKGPAFSDDEKIKLREYVMRGGTLLVQACRPGKPSTEFDENFRALMEDCFPETELKPLQPGHTIYITPRKIARPPKIEVMTFKDRIGVIYIPQGLCLDWQREGASAKPSLDVGVNIVFYVLKQAGKLGGKTVPAAEAAQ